MHLNGFGEIVREEWLRTAELRSNVELDAFVVMPNHVHGIIIITETLEDLATGATQRVAPTKRNVPAVGATGPVAPSPRGPKSGLLGAIVGQFKSITAKRINRVRGTPGAPIWQRNYYDHIIRDERGLDRIRDYIAGNPGRWLEDALHPSSR